MAQALSPDAAQLLAVISTGRRKRWPLTELEVKQLQALPHLRGRPERRRELGSVIQELSAAGRLRPSVREDRSQMPALPMFVDVVRAPNGNGASPRTHGWRPELAGVTALAPAATPAELRILRKVNRWLADRGQEAPVCGSRERSLEVFGDEKLLDERLRYGRLFATGIFTYEVLRARRIAPGLVHEIVGAVPIALVIENADTFRSIADVLAARPDPEAGLLAWGAGASFEQSCEALRTMQVAGTPIERVYYFGDIDPSGLRIPARAAQLIQPLALLPAAPLYALLLDRNQRGPGRERLGEGADDHLRWLGEPLASRARAVMEAGDRLAQEALTSQLLHQRVSVLA